MNESPEQKSALQGNFEAFKRSQGCSEFSLRKDIVTGQYVNSGIGRQFECWCEATCQALAGNPERCAV